MTTTLTGREYWNFTKPLALNVSKPERGRGGGNRERDVLALRRHFSNAQPPLSVAGRAPHARLPPAEYPVQSKVMTTPLTGREYWNFTKPLALNVFKPEHLVPKYFRYRVLIHR
jgi:hypothetical protein